jgi:hypothetical protein
MRSVGFSSGEYGGNNSNTMFSGTSSGLLVCHPAESKYNIIRNFLYALLKATRNTFITPVLVTGAMIE